MTNIRFDTIRIDKADWKELPNGSLRVPVTMTRTGIFNYYQDGVLIKEYRPDAEVFKQDSLDTAISLPVTDDHPPTMVNTENSKIYIKGLTDPTVRKDGQFVRSYMTITDADLIQKIKAGKRQVSLGYEVKTLDQSGEFNGERYDRIQTNIKYNHLAVVDVARGGYQVRIDSADYFISDDLEDKNDSKGEKKKMAELRIDDGSSVITVEVPDTSVNVIAEKIRKDSLEIKSTKERLDAVEVEKTNLANEKALLQGKFDTLKEEVARLDGMVKEVARQKLIEEVKDTLKDVKFDGMTEREIKISYIKSKVPNFSVDDKTEDSYIQGRFDSIKEMEVLQPKPSVKDSFGDSALKARQDSSDVEVISVENAIKKINGGK